MKSVAQITRLKASISNTPHLPSCPATSLQPRARPSRRSSAVIATVHKRWISAEAKARDLSQQSIDEELSEYDQQISEEKGKQAERPWHREGADQPPVRRQRSAGAMTKGKLLTTPSRLLKLVLPLTTRDTNSDRKDVAPLALLIHPQQPLSYLERLIQAELPSISNDKGDSRLPSISFRAMEAKDDEIKPKKQTEADSDDTGDGSVQSYSGDGREGTGKDDGNFVRWSASTEIGDFIRDAARAKEFEVEIEGAPDVVNIAVPSFNDRTYYLRQRLRRTAKQISNMSTIKQECDMAAHRGAQRIAMSGCGILVGYWYIVYRLTFETDLGWDTMEPVTYLVGLSTLIAGYMWFLWHNREVSYRQAMNITITSRQSKLYEARGFQLQKWETLVEEANAIRKEIKAVASEYDVQWDERKDEQDEAVTKAMRDERRAHSSKNGKKKEGDEDDNEED